MSEHFGRKLVRVTSAALFVGACASSQGMSPQMTHGCPPNAPARVEVLRFGGPEFPDFEPRAPSSPDSLVIFGYVRAATDSSALPGVIVHVLGTNAGTLSDSLGQYALMTSKSVGDSVRYSLIGYHLEAYEIPRDSTLARMDIELEEERYCL